jgi:hypothetical protein
MTCQNSFGIREQRHVQSVRQVRSLAGEYANLVLLEPLADRERRCVVRVVQEPSPFRVPLSALLVPPALFLDL